MKLEPALRDSWFLQLHLWVLCSSIVYYYRLLVAQFVCILLALATYATIRITFHFLPNLGVDLSIVVVKQLYLRFQWKYPFLLKCCGVPQAQKGFYKMSVRR